MLSKKGKRLITAFENAAVAVSWKGAGYPEDAYRTEKNYERKRAALMKYLADLERNQKDV